ncbi:MAG: YlxR family protein [Eubacteriales bacterium]|nr:YlxR family protein [Eubacteriales bacterium]
MKQRKIPMRKCTGCNEMKPKSELIRVVKAPDKVNEQGEVIEKGEISLDLTSKKPGRGAYICKDINCFLSARKAKRFERAFSTQIPSSVYDSMEEELTKSE